MKTLILSLERIRDVAPLLQRPVLNDVLKVLQEVDAYEWAALKARQELRGVRAALGLELDGDENLVVVANNMRLKLNSAMSSLAQDAAKRKAATKEKRNGDDAAKD